jgi:DNA helicase-2/ATP-dependent DNA helicase PcrA
MLVDEFQDTNRAQLLLVKALVGEGGNVFCVGDDDQSHLRLARRRHLQRHRFRDALPRRAQARAGAELPLPRPVLDLANAMMEGQVRAFPKRLFTDKPGGAR